MLQPSARAGYPCWVLGVERVEIFLLRLALEETGKEIPSDDLRQGFGVAVFVDDLLRPFYALRRWRWRHQLGVGPLPDQCRGWFRFRFHGCALMMQSLAGISWGESMGEKYVRRKEDDDDTKELRIKNAASRR